MINFSQLKFGFDFSTNIKSVKIIAKANYPSPFQKSQSSYVYKMAFYCKAVSFEIKKGFDILDVQYFATTIFLNFQKTGY